MRHQFGGQSTDFGPGEIAVETECRAPGQIHGDPRLVTAYRCVVLAGIFVGSQLDLPLVWAIADLSMGFMTVVNLVAVLLLSGLVIKLMRDYNKQLAFHIEPVFEVDRHPEIRARLPKGGW